jgi:hypothetical protein
MYICQLSDSPINLAVGDKPDKEGYCTKQSHDTGANPGCFYNNEHDNRDYKAPDYQREKVAGEVSDNRVGKFRNTFGCIFHK